MTHDIYRAPDRESTVNTRNSSMTVPRRQLLQGLGTIGLATLAGCTTAFGGRGASNDGQSDPGSTPSGSVHWHVQLTVEIQGEPQQIPADIGIGSQYSGSPYYDEGMQMTSMHTHDDSGTIHWEVMQTPKEGELRLGAFFDVWGKPFSETCLFDYCGDDGGTVTMTVNGETNHEYGDHVVSDGDDILIRYE